MRRPRLVLWNLVCCSVAFVSIVAISDKALARGQYLQFWQQNYPESSSSAANCQLCHSSIDGGNGWNFYGSNIRGEAGGQENLSQQDFLSIVNFIETDRSTDDGCGAPGVSTGPTFLDEIRYNAQPGWREGNVNAIRRRNGVCNDNQAPQFSGNAQSALDLPAAFNGDPVVTVGSGNVSIELHTVASDFNLPVKAVTAPGIAGSIFVVELRGKIIRVNLASGEKSTFADLESSLVPARSGYDERGLLGLAFHPNFDNNGLFYTYQSQSVSAGNSPADYSTILNPDHRSVIVEHRASVASCNSTISSGRNLLVIDQPQFNHNGGDLAFGQDGFLYISVGDGGAANDNAPGHGLNGNGRNTDNPLGAILRIDVNGSNASNGRYGLPGDNPFFADMSGAEEIYAYGLRNPTGDLFTGDVGQGDIEEVDKIVLGGNYGWNWKEGNKFFFTTSGLGSFISNTGPAGLPNLIEPIAEYDHDDGRSITGGNVYRGSQVPALTGDYLFADYGAGAGPSGRLFYLDNRVGPVLSLNVSAPRSEYFTGFGQDSENELYVLGSQSVNPVSIEGTLYKIQGLGATYSAPDAGDESSICPEVEDDSLCLPIRSGSRVAVICL